MIRHHVLTGLLKKGRVTDVKWLDNSRLQTGTQSRLVLSLMGCCPVLRAVTLLMEGYIIVKGLTKFLQFSNKTGSSCGWSRLIPTSLRACAKVELGIEITWEVTFECSIALDKFLKLCLQYSVCPEWSSLVLGSSGRLCSLTAQKRC
jgi:hypothetical protein